MAYCTVSFSPAAHQLSVIDGTNVNESHDAADTLQADYSNMCPVCHEDIVVDRTGSAAVYRFPCVCKSNVMHLDCARPYLAQKLKIWLDSQPSSLACLPSCVCCRTEYKHVQLVSDETFIFGAIVESLPMPYTLEYKQRSSTWRRTPSGSKHRWRSNNTQLARLAFHASDDEDDSDNDDGDSHDNRTRRIQWSSQLGSLLTTPRNSLESSYLDTTS